MILRDIPSVDIILNNCEPLFVLYGRKLTTKAIRKVLDDVRSEILEGKEVSGQEILSTRINDYLEEWTKPTLQSVINATGVILHTNLGRAPLSSLTIKLMSEIANGYSNIEFDIFSGKRGSRMVHIEPILQNLTGAEAGLVVNNCASAVLLVLSALAYRKSIIIPRSQLIEIGGGFRIPDVMKQSGAKLIEIGTTNKIRISDFEDVLSAASPSSQIFVMRAHRSNFQLVGFTEEPELKSIIDMAHKYNAIFIDDLGSGALIDTAQYGMAHEPTIQESLSSGADIVMFSGDKLIGGPQSGIIVGRSELISKIKKHPLARAVRADKICLAGIYATLSHYLKDEAESEIPLWRMISTPLKTIKTRAEYWQVNLGIGEILGGESTIGGGSLPGETFPTWVLALNVKSPEKSMRILRKNTVPIIARTQNNQILFDPRTVLPEQDEMLVNTLKKIV
ncbi:MAG: L-seryl-tRNA(Sec) selenium transferase [Chloroflexota bacterium]